MQGESLMGYQGPQRQEEGQGDQGSFETRRSHPYNSFICFGHGF
jgi:hypothetical protein